MILESGLYHSILNTRYNYQSEKRELSYALIELINPIIENYNTLAMYECPEALVQCLDACMEDSFLRILEIIQTYLLIDEEF